MELTRYFFEDEEGNLQGWSTDSYSEAVEHASRYDYALYAYTFEYTDKELLQTPASWDRTAEED